MLLNKVIDFADTQVSMVILMDNITAYMMELRMPYNRYLAMMKGLRAQGWKLKPESKADIFYRMIRN